VNEASLQYPMKTLFQRNILVNILLILALLVALVYALFKSLNTITKHGQDATVANVLGEKLPTAMQKLAGFEFQIDSIYLPYKNPLEVLYQEPQAGSIVKKGRTIFLTVNRSTPPMVAMPNLVNISFRNAIFTLLSNKLIMGDTIFRPDIAAGSVLEQMYNGKPIAVGSNVPEGAHIDLVVGILPDTAVDVPNLIGKSFTEVRTILDGLFIQYSIVWDGSISDSGSAVIYNQQPEAINELDFGNTINPGDIIDLRIMQRPSAELLQMNQPGAMKYFDPNDTSSPVSVPVVEVPANTETDASSNQSSRRRSRQNVLDDINAQESPNANGDLNDPANPDYKEPRLDPNYVPVNPPSNNNASNNNASTATPKKVEDKKKTEDKKVEDKKKVDDKTAKPAQKLDAAAAAKAKLAEKTKVPDAKKTADAKKVADAKKAVDTKKAAETKAQTTKPKVADKPAAKLKPIEKPKPKKEAVKKQNANDFKNEYE
jgi:eukaryotic-like serine/threonine-protein kinase